MQVLVSPVLEGRLLINTCHGAVHAESKLRVLALPCPAPSRSYKQYAIRALPNDKTRNTHAPCSGKADSGDLVYECLLYYFIRLHAASTEAHSYASSLTLRTSAPSLSTTLTPASLYPS